METRSSDIRVKAWAHPLTTYFPTANYGAAECFEEDDDLRVSFAKIDCLFCFVRGDLPLIVVDAVGSVNSSVSGVSFMPGRCCTETLSPGSGSTAGCTHVVVCAVWLT